MPSCCMSDPLSSDLPLPVKFRGGGFAPVPRRWVGYVVFIVLVVVLLDVLKRYGWRRLFTPE